MSNLDTKFRDMPAGTRKGWLDWANSHDWGSLDAYYEGDFMVAYGQSHTPSKGWVEDRNLFATPREMRNWAGY